jgi:hypothetical protein
MTTQERSGNRLATRTEQPPTTNKLPARGFPIQRSIQQLSDDLDALNERIAELEKEGHRGYAMEVLKANAMDFARRIDELRCVLIVVPTKKDAPNKKLRHRWTRHVIEAGSQKGNRNEKDKSNGSSPVVEGGRSHFENDGEVKGRGK